MSIWKKFPSLEKSLLDIVKDNLDNLASVKEVYRLLLEECGSKEKRDGLTEQGVLMKLVHESRKDDKVKDVLNNITKSGKKKVRKENKALIESIKEEIDRLVFFSGYLLDGTRSDLYKEVRDKFKDEIKESNTRFNRSIFNKYLHSVIWTKERSKSLDDFMRRDMPLELFAKHNSKIPLSEIKKEADNRSGKSQKISHPVTFSGGINRINPLGLGEIEGDDLFHLPGGSFDEPYDLDIKGNFLVINAANIGWPHSRLISENPVRCALEEAEAEGYEAVMITGGLINMDLKQAHGSMQLYRALLSGHNINTDVILDPVYKKKVERILKEGQPHELIYEVLAERFLNLLAGWKKIAVKRDGTPEFSGKIFIQFGITEEELIKTAASFETRYWTIQRQRDLKVECAAAEQELTDIQRELDSAIENKAPDIIIKEIQARKEQKEKEVEPLIAEEQRTRMTNISKDQRVSARVYRQVLAFVVNMFEEHIPNSKVISTGDVTIRTALGKKALIYQAKSETVTDGVLDKFLKQKGGAMTLRHKAPNLILLAHPYSLNYRWAEFEWAEKGRRSSTQVVQLPATLHRDVLKEKTSEHLKVVSPFQRMLRHEQFQPGVVGFKVSANSDWLPQIYPTPSLIQRSVNRRRHKKRKGSNDQSDQFIYLLIDTDPHYGHPWKDYIWDNENQTFLGLGPAFIEMMRRDGLLSETNFDRFPFHIWSTLDDMTQGHNFPTERQPHQNKLSFYEAERRIKELLSKRGKKIEAIREIALQLRFRGEHWPQDQVNDYIRDLDKNLDFYRALLSRAKASGLDVKGASHHLGYTKDSRDIGIINFGTGNHIGKTVEDQLTEGNIFSKMLRARLLGLPEWKDETSNQELEKFIKSPLHGNDHIGLGTVSAPGGYEWGLYLRNAPARKSGLGDPLRNAVKNALLRGNFPRFFEDRFFVSLSGDIHRYGAVATPYFYQISCASTTDTDPYGERGFNPNNTGLLVVGLPVKGAHSGPLRLVAIRHQFIRDYFESPRKIDWESLFPNPV